LDYKAPDNIYWLFSASAQTIAAFIGFLAAGFFFIYSKIDKIIEQDETLEDIFNDIKHQYYIKIILLLILTGVSIITSLFIVFINGYNLGIYVNILWGFGALINLITIIWAIYFVIYMINPNKITLTNNKLIKENKLSFESINNKRIISSGEFITKFIELEKILRKIATERNVLFINNRRISKPISLNKLALGLSNQLLINNKQYQDLLKIIKIRNLVVHGEIDSINPQLGELIEKLINSLKGKLKN